MPTTTIVNLKTGEESTILNQHGVIHNLISEAMIQAGDGERLFNTAARDRYADRIEFGPRTARLGDLYVDFGPTSIVVTPEMEAAFLYVKGFFPDVVVVVYRADDGWQTWEYINEDGSFPSFRDCPALDVTLLGEALDTVPCFPCVYRGEPAGTDLLAA